MAVSLAAASVWPGKIDWGIVMSLSVDAGLPPAGDQVRWPQDLRWGVLLLADYPVSRSGNSYNQK